MKTYFSTLLLVGLFSTLCFAKRPAPSPVEPVVQENIIYSVPHWASQNGTTQNGGVIRAGDQKTGETLWQVQVYSVEYDEDLESDVQDVFIKSIKLDGEQNTLIIENELGQVFHLNTKTKRVVEIE